MKTRLLRDIEVSAVGIGCMGFHHGYGPTPDREEAVRLIRYAVDLGCTPLIRRKANPHFSYQIGFWGAAARGRSEALKRVAVVG
jgi:hypothetical protein